MSILDELRWRELIYQETDRESLKNALSNKVTIYLGVDPTADSLHIGHLIPYITSYRFMQFGHKVIFLLGESTAKVGDPSGKTTERSLIDNEKIHHNSLSIKRQIESLFCDTDNYIIESNNTWFDKINIIDFLRDYGKFLNISKMFAKDIVKTRIENGMSFTEFSYQLLQAIDFYKLNSRHNCILQIGGSDQWGNIVSGIELIKKISGNTVFGITQPLVKKSDGSKFGKTSKGNVWLDKNKTNIFDFYQFWYNTNDDDVISYLKLFTFLSYKKIHYISELMKTQPKKRYAQKVLADEITKFVHGIDELNKVHIISEILFSKNLSETLYKLENINLTLGDGPILFIKKENNYKIIDLLILLKFCSSKTEARKLLKNNAIRFNDILINEENFDVSKNNTYTKNISIIKKSKKTFYILVFN